MEDTLTLDRDVTEEIDYDSFLEIEQQEEDQVSESGMAKLIGVSSVEDYDDKEGIQITQGDEYVFEARMERGDEKMILVADEGDIEFMREWCEVDDTRSTITGLAGKTVPIQENPDGSYKIYKFTFLRDRGLSIDDVRSLESNEAVVYEEGSWRISEVWHKHNLMVTKIQSIAGILSMSIALVGLYAVLFVSFFLWFAVMTVWVGFLGIEKYLEYRKKHKPFPSIIRQARKSEGL